jgi:hypothetical protein
VFWWFQQSDSLLVWLLLTGTGTVGYITHSIMVWFLLIRTGTMSYYTFNSDLVLTNHNWNHELLPTQHWNMLPKVGIQSNKISYENVLAKC